jgi:hypothetical protein
VDRSPWLSPGLAGSSSSRQLWLAQPGPVRIADEEIYFVSRGNTKEYCNCPNDVDPKTPSGQSEGDIAVGRLRLDGLFSLDAPYSSAVDAAVLETKPFVYAAASQQLLLNLDATSGSVVVSVFVGGGSQATGSGDDELPVLVSAPLVHNDVNHAVRFLNRPDDTSVNETGIAALALAGTPIRLQFRMQSCRLYGFRFVGSAPAPAPAPVPPPPAKKHWNVTTLEVMWAATGCSNPFSATAGEQSYWESTPDGGAADMFLYCQVTKAGTATKLQLAVCGSVKGACALQRPQSHVVAAGFSS